MIQRKWNDRASDAAIGLALVLPLAVVLGWLSLRSGLVWLFVKLEWLGSSFREVAYRDWAKKAVEQREGK